MPVAVVLYDRLFMPFMQRLTKNPRSISLLQRMGVGLVIHIVIMGIASVTERHRLAVAREHDIYNSNGTTIPLTIFVLLPQFEHGIHFFAIEKTITDGSCSEPSVKIDYHRRFCTRTVCDK